jgi:4-amino-4-deoxy-L-arabinose transferase-like glycosyltransferase
MSRAYPSRHLVSETRPAARGQAESASLAAGLRGRLPLLGVGALYLLALLIIPVMTPVAIGDDWVYARSVEILINEGRVRILDLSVVTLVWQVLWGGLFAAILGPTFGAMRLSTVVLTGIAGLACYGCCRQVGASRGRAALGAALYLFNPLLFSISYSFMSDAHFVGLLTISAYCYLRGLRPDRPSIAFTLLGAFAAGLAFLERQQGALIPLAAVTYLLLGGRLRPNRAGVVLFTQVVAVPAAMTILYFLWFRFIHGIPKAQGDFLQKVIDTGVGGALLLIGRLAVIEAAYVGLFLLPLGIAALLALPRLLRAMRPVGWAAFAGWAAFIVGSGIVFWQSGRRMPYIPHYLAPYGLGSYDLRGGRPWLIGQRGMDIATIVTMLGALLLGLLLCVGLSGSRAQGARPRGSGPSTTIVDEKTAARAGAGLTLALAFWQLVGVLPQSFTFQNWSFRGYNAPSLDRYLLPLLPLAVILALWAIREVRVVMAAAWTLALVMAVFSIVGTRDFLVFHTAVWDVARQLNREGVPDTRIDAGAGWDGYRLYEYSMANNITTPVAVPWWIGLFAPADTADYIIAGTPRDDFSDRYEPIGQVEYSTWLNPEPTYLYILRRDDVLGLP